MFPAQVNPRSIGRTRGHCLIPQRMCRSVLPSYCITFSSFNGVVQDHLLSRCVQYNDAATVVSSSNVTATILERMSRCFSCSTLSWSYYVHNKVKKIYNLINILLLQVYKD